MQRVSGHQAWPSSGGKVGIPKDIDRGDVLGAAIDLVSGTAHPFGESRDYDVLIDGQRFAPKAVVGLAARRTLGRILGPAEFSGGEASGQANAVLRSLGFQIVPTALPAKAWLFLQRPGKHAGNAGYPDVLGETYVYDANVQYHKQIAEGDVALVHDGHELLGVGTIELIKPFTAPKRRQRCPNCGVTNILPRASGPRFRCQRCGEGFDDPKVEVIEDFPYFAAQYGSYLPSDKLVLVSELRAASSATATQLSIRPVDTAALPTTVTALLERLLRTAGRSAGPVWAPPGPSSETVILGSSYRSGATAPLHVGLEMRTNLDALDRGTQRHIDTLDKLAAFLQQKGLNPLPAGNAGIPFDLGWKVGDRLWIAEVKSTVQAVERQQLRLGLGQVLDYRERLASIGSDPRCSLVVEREPTEARWTKVCAMAEVVLAWPGSFDRLLTADT